MADQIDGGWSAPTTSGTARRPRSRPAAAPAPSEDSAWGPATSNRAGGVRAAAPAPTRSNGSNNSRDHGGDGARDNPRAASRELLPPRPSPAAGDEWAAAGPLPSRDQRATRRAERADRVADTQAQAAARRSYRDSYGDAYPDQASAAPRAPERGLPWWAALLVLVVIAAIGGLIDTIGAFQVKGGFNIGIVVASVLAVLIVKRSNMFPVVIAPPIVYSAAALFQLYIRSSGLHDKKVVFDAAANYLVYGFPAIAAATAAVLIIAGIRLIIRK